MLGSLRCEAFATAAPVVYASVPVIPIPISWIERDPGLLWLIRARPALAPPVPIYSYLLALTALCALRAFWVWGDEA